MTVDSGERRKALIDALIMVQKEIMYMDDIIKEEAILSVKHLMLARRAGMQHIAEQLKAMVK